MLQIECLARHFASRSTHFGSVYSSDLSRARITAEGICRLQPPNPDGTSIMPILTPDLRERDFGSLEGMNWNSTTAARDNAARSGGGSSSIHRHIEGESSASMERRATAFLSMHILPLLFDAPSSEMNVAIVAHGIILRVLWNSLVGLYDPMDISMAPGIAPVEGGTTGLPIPSWSNTAFMKLSIQPRTTLSATHNSLPDHRTTTSSALLQGWTMNVMAINSREHLAVLRRTRGGIGSATHDTRQKRIEQFFKR